MDLGYCRGQHNLVCTSSELRAYCLLETNQSTDVISSDKSWFSVNRASSYCLVCKFHLVRIFWVKTHVFHIVPVPILILDLRGGHHLSVSSVGVISFQYFIIILKSYVRQSTKLFCNIWDTNRKLNIITHVFVPNRVSRWNMRTGPPVLRWRVVFHKTLFVINSISHPWSYRT